MQQQRIIGIVSGKGGVGKTTCTVNLGLAMHLFGKDVMLVDTDITNANLCMHLGNYSPPAGVQKALGDNTSPLDIVCTHPTGLNFIPADISMDFIDTELQATKLRRFLRDIHCTVLLDGPPSLENNAQAVIKSSDEILVVTNPEMPSVIDSLKVIKFAKMLEKPVLGLILNRNNRYFSLTKENIEQVCGEKVLALVPEDRDVKKSIFLKQPLVALKPYSATSIAFRKLAAELHGETFRPPGISFLRGLLERFS
ncbi:MAG: P-loop NTPase [Candidatus Aenigmarchaeota archaeon]|nr:P-loop NTPase [Candidatus Aenigmarchaeota archaeon]